MTNIKNAYIKHPQKYISTGVMKHQCEPTNLYFLIIYILKLT